MTRDSEEEEEEEEEGVREEEEEEEEIRGEFFQHVVGFFVFLC
jgi:hypothetical protein